MNVNVPERKFCLFVTVRSMVVVISAADLTFRTAPRAIM